MNELNELVSDYIESTFIPNVKLEILAAMHIISLLDHECDDTGYITIILNDDIPNDAKSDLFLFEISEKLKSILEQHGVTINEEYTPRLSELSEIVHLLHIIQVAESYDDISYKVNSDNTSKKILVSLITTYTSLEEYRAYELILYVDDSLINGIKDLVNYKDAIVDKSIPAHIAIIKNFFKFVNNSECLGLSLFHFGCIDLTIDDILELMTIEATEHIDSLMPTNKPQAALDCLSILLLAVDTYSAPIEAYKQNPYKFTSKLENVTKIEAMMSAMLLDFNTWLDVKKQEQKLNKEGVTNGN